MLSTLVSANLIFVLITFNLMPSSICIAIKPVLNKDANKRSAVYYMQNETPMMIPSALFQPIEAPTEKPLHFVHMPPLNNPNPAWLSNAFMPKNNFNNYNNFNNENNNINNDNNVNLHNNNNNNIKYNNNDNNNNNNNNFEDYDISLYNRLNEFASNPNEINNPNNLDTYAPIRYGDSPYDGYVDIIRLTNNNNNNNNDYDNNNYLQYDQNPYQSPHSYTHGYSYSYSVSSQDGQQPQFHHYEYETRNGVPVKWVQS